jgi:hypothetical protein
MYASVAMPPVEWTTNKQSRHKAERQWTTNDDSWKETQERSVLTEDVGACPPVAGVLLQGGIPLPVHRPVLGVHVRNLSHGVRQSGDAQLRVRVASCVLQICNDSSGYERFVRV